MLKFKTSCAVLANLSSNLLNEVGLSLYRYFEVGLRVCDIVVNKYVRYLISWWVLVVYCHTSAFVVCAIKELRTFFTYVLTRHSNNCQICIVLWMNSVSIISINLFSGGTAVTVYGSNLDSVAEPRITLTVITSRFDDATNTTSTTNETTSEVTLISCK